MGMCSDSGKVMGEGGHSTGGKRTDTQRVDFTFALTGRALGRLATQGVATVALG